MRTSDAFRFCLLSTHVKLTPKFTTRVNRSHMEASLKGCTKVPSTPQAAPQEGESLLPACVSAARAGRGSTRVLTHGMEQGEGTFSNSVASDCGNICDAGGASRVP